MQPDIAIIGGSFAGLAAALQIARARRPVLVIDAGQPRNRFAASAHGFLGQDGRSPRDILADARTQLLRYPTVSLVTSMVDHVKRSDGGFTIASDAGSFTARRLILAHGIRDELPNIAGIAGRWGHTALHCPYCHGYEFAGRRLGVLASGPLSLHQATLVADWGPVTLFTNGTFHADDAQRAQLARHNIAVEDGKVTALHGDAPALESVLLADGRRIPVEALFLAPRQSAPTFAADLGCDFTEGPLGSYVTADEFRRTSVAGVFAAGDMARLAQNVAGAVADGTMAGAAAHQSLVFE